jgi:predicted amidophosphoribosyltransferase
MFSRPASWLLDGAARLRHALPSECGICGRWPAQRVCGDCLARWAGERPRCRRCALPLAGGATECGACLRAPPALDMAWTAVDYGYPWSALLTQFKFHGDPGAAQALALLLARCPGAVAALASAALIVPVPLSRARLRERGFNQAALLAQALARLPQVRLPQVRLPQVRLPQVRTSSSRAQA